ncbi:GNAT family N-acetyltransferase [Spongiimicrobium sp. 3-5]|uniref:GNAT family N-acetyltransferase n=1 Tax=Spongiimicrobium sp. 3-5 TaxID=3332596 RepID=UPI00397FBB1A
MKHLITIAPLTKKTFCTYIDVGSRSYREHYLHLWKRQDPSPYIESSFTTEVLHKENMDDNIDHFIIQKANLPVGILKIIKNSAAGSYSSGEALLLEKIYLLKAYSGQGIGKIAFDFVFDYARELGKKALWLDVMATSPALKVYQKIGFKKIGAKELHFLNVKDEERKMFVLSKVL